MGAKPQRSINADAEQAVLGAILKEPVRWHEVSGLRVDDFGVEAHQNIFAAMNAASANGEPIDAVLLLRRLGNADQAYLSTLIRNCPCGSHISQYATAVKEAAIKRYAAQLAETIASAATNGCNATELSQRFTEAAAKLADRNHGTQDWRSLFHSYEELMSAPPLRFAIEGFLQEAGITLIGGLAGHGKTLIMLAMARSLLEQRALFGYSEFQVPRPAERVLYLVPEASLGAFKTRLEVFRMTEHVRSRRLFVHTLSSNEQVSLTDPRMLKAAEGADVFLDTAVRFINGAENDVESAKIFAKTLFDLLRAGARTVTGAHHAPKGFELQCRMTLENILRGSGDIGAMLSTAWGIRQIDEETNSIYVQNVKPRDFEPCKAFVIKGRPHLDDSGEFVMSNPPGTAGGLRDHLHSRGGRPETPGKAEKVQQVVSMRAQGASLSQMAKAAGVSIACVRKWLDAHDQVTVHQPCTNDVHG